MEEKIIRRDQYLDRIKPFLDKHIIKILTGQRRVGKSYMLKMIIKHIKENQPEANVIYVDKELEKFSEITNHSDLDHYVNQELIQGKPNYLFIDEVQEIVDFQRCLRSLLNEQACDIYCTGSNANILSGELATLMAGRYIEFPIHSLSYAEFLTFNQLEDKIENLELYLTVGGMPYQHHIGLNPGHVFEYLKNVYSSILLRDVVSWEGIRNVSLLENLVAYLADNTGSLFSAQNISKYLKSQRVNIPTQTVINYLKALTNSYFIHKVARADINGLKIFEIGEKYYFEDLGLRNSIRSFNYRSDIGKLMENAVYMQLLRNGFRVFVGKFQDKEIDFIGEKNGERLYVQVCYALFDEVTIQREFGNLMNVADNYPKYVITMDMIKPLNTFKGIQQMPLRDFLKMDFT
ncbi:putative AAA+ superfamily ATPase [Algoriphagus sp. 4150]|uniref:ATP-binding protein n=1 Tax=Algoriphagus sp. 4150 TaxID=2817756 RepID=UPI00285DD88C|nr:ATP-binding protein [Algoriphagus sp. 4150]MDR7132707.1 putative AAA+ superfamily ATPase [Algoriphagus sp. 4150]